MSGLCSMAYFQHAVILLAFSSAMNPDGISGQPVVVIVVSGDSVQKVATTTSTKCSPHHMAHLMRTA